MNTALEFKNEASISSVTFKGFDGELIDQSKNIIKVIGVGGGGSNAVKNMVNEGLVNVSYALVNTDSQALKNATVLNKIPIGEKGLGVGGDPEAGRAAAEFSIESIKNLFEDNTKMVFITAGMGGGTGTGASPVIARVARERGILTVGVVTLPFKFEKQQRIDKALKGVAALKNEVDSLIVINNERLIEICDDANTSIEDALKISDQVVTTATRSIAEIITKEGLINRDFCDVRTVLDNGGAAIMSTGRASGDNRIVEAMCNALNSPMLNQAEIAKSHKLLYIVYQSHENSVRMPELNAINNFMEQMAPDLEVLWGLYYDDTLGDDVRIDIVATGFDKERSRESRSDELAKKIDAMRAYYYNQESTTDTDSDIVAILKSKCSNKPEVKNNQENNNHFFENLYHNPDDEITENEEYNTDETSDTIILFNDDEDEDYTSVRESAPSPVAAVPVQSQIDFGNDVSSFGNESTDTIEMNTYNSEETYNDTIDDVEEAKEEQKSTLGQRLSQFMGFIDRIVTES